MSGASSALPIEIAEAFVPLLAPKRYKGAYGGRGSGKSHFFAEQMIARCFSGTTRAVCIREVQNSLKESVKQLLADKIAKLGVGSYFDILESEIRGPHGSLIIFRGMQSYNAETIKSLEGYDIAWVEEAQSLSAHSLRMLRPTIRKPGSELWFSWNPRYDTDAIDKLARGPAPPSNSVFIEVNWYDNPWFPAELRDEKNDDYAADREQAEHVWGGGYQVVSEGAYYAKMLAEAERAGRIGDFPHLPNVPVKTAWDIGVDDYTAVWFMQDDGRSARAIDYYEVSGDGAEQIVRACMPELIPDPVERLAGLAEIGRLKPFAYGRHFLPHDVNVREWGGGARTRFQTLLALGVKPIQAGAQQGASERINAVRRVLPIVSFNNTKRVQIGLSRLRRYARRWNDQMQTYQTPLHDENSHGADAFGEWAVNCGIHPKPAAPPSKPKSGYSSAAPSQGSWRV